MTLGAMEGTGLTFVEGDKTTAVTADKYFTKISLADETICCVQVFFNEDGTHTGAGTLYIQGTNEPNPTDNAAATTEWDTLDVVFNRAVTSGIGMASANMAFLGWRWIRVFYDFTSGSGSMRVLTVVKTK